MRVPKDLVSIGMPAYNCEAFVKQALDSLTNQTYSKFELIISDDASVDKTADICKLYTKKDSRILYIRQAKNIGFLKNFNYVLKKARGKYFMWAGCDDLWEKTYVEKLYTALKNHRGSVLAVSKFNNLYRSRRYDYLKNQHKASGLDHLHSILFFMNSRNLSYYYGLHRTKNLKKIHGYHGDSRPFFHSSDYLTIFQALLHGPLTYVDEILFIKRDRGLFTLRYEVLKDLKINRTVFLKILRFLLFPIYYLYDLWFSIQYTFASDLGRREKIIVIFFSCVYFMRNIFKFFFEVAIGIILVMSGIIERYL